ncbi:hypothetical protein GN956_G5665 [Arapaima gigas]
MRSRRRRAADRHGNSDDYNQHNPHEVLQRAASEATRLVIEVPPKSSESEGCGPCVREVTVILSLDDSRPRLAGPTAGADRREPRCTVSVQ